MLPEDRLRGGALRHVVTYRCNVVTLHSKPFSPFQELPECAPAGQLPRSVDIIADNDLADLVSPGDRVRIIGLYRVLPNKQNGFSNGSFRYPTSFLEFKVFYANKGFMFGFCRSIVISNNIQLLSKETTLDFDPEDVRNIRKLSRKKDVSRLFVMTLSLP